jgi:hypothetical protein
MKRSTKAIGLLAIGVAAYGVLHKSAPAADDNAVFDRIWVEKKPESLTDYVHAFYAMGSEKNGLFLSASAYAGKAERFDFNKEKGKLVILFPQTGKKEELSYTVKTCSDLPPYDLCLDLKSNPWGGPTRYYASTDDSESARTKARFSSVLPAK